MFIFWVTAALRFETCTQKSNEDNNKVSIIPIKRVVVVPILPEFVSFKLVQIAAAFKDNRTKWDITTSPHKTHFGGDFLSTGKNLLAFSFDRWPRTKCNAIFDTCFWATAVSERSILFGVLPIKTHMERIWIFWRIGQEKKTLELH